MRIQQTDERLRRWLRRGDPAAEELPPDAAAMGRIRARMLAEMRPASGRQPRLSWAAAAALAIALLLLGHRETVRLPWRGRVPEAAVSVAAPVARQIHFVTAKGTRVYWTLDPDFRL